MAYSLTFGLFPLGVAGSRTARPPGRRMTSIRSGAVEYLQSDGPPLLARMYVSWTGAASTASTLAQM